MFNLSLDWLFLWLFGTIISQWKIRYMPERNHICRLLLPVMFIHLHNFHTPVDDFFSHFLLLLSTLSFVFHYFPLSLVIPFLMKRFVCSAWCFSPNKNSSIISCESKGEWLLTFLIPVSCFHITLGFFDCSNAVEILKWILNQTDFIL